MQYVIDLDIKKDILSFTFNHNCDIYDTQTMEITNIQIGGDIFEEIKNMLLSNITPTLKLKYTPDLGEGTTPRIFNIKYNNVTLSKPPIKLCTISSATYSHTSEEKNTNINGMLAWEQVPIFFNKETFASEKSTTEDTLKVYRGVVSGRDTQIVIFQGYENALPFPHKTAYYFLYNIGYATHIEYIYIDGIPIPWTVTETEVLLAVAKNNEKHHTLNGIGVDSMKGTPALPLKPTITLSVEVESIKFPSWRSNSEATISLITKTSVAQGWYSTFYDSPLDPPLTLVTDAEGNLPKFHIKHTMPLTLSLNAIGIAVKFSGQMPGSQHVDDVIIKTKISTNIIVDPPNALGSHHPFANGILLNKLLSVLSDKEVEFLIPPLPDENWMPLIATNGHTIKKCSLDDIYTLFHYMNFVIWESNDNILKISQHNSPFLINKLLHCPTISIWDFEWGNKKTINTIVKGTDYKIDEEEVEDITINTEDIFYGEFGSVIFYNSKETTQNTITLPTSLTLNSLTDIFDIKGTASEPDFSFFQLSSPKKEMILFNVAYDTPNTIQSSNVQPAFAKGSAETYNGGVQPLNQLLNSYHLHYFATTSVSIKSPYGGIDILYTKDGDTEIIPSTAEIYTPYRIGKNISFKCTKKDITLIFNNHGYFKSFTPDNLEIYIQLQNYSWDSGELFCSCNGIIFDTINDSEIMKGQKSIIKKASHESI